LSPGTERSLVSCNPCFHRSGSASSLPQPYRQSRISPRTLFSLSESLALAP